MPSTSTAFTNESSSIRCATGTGIGPLADDLAHLPGLRRAPHQRGVVDAHDGDGLTNGGPRCRVPVRDDRANERSRRASRRSSNRRSNARSAHPVSTGRVDAAGAVGVGPAPERARPTDAVVRILVDTRRRLDPSAWQPTHAVVPRTFQQRLRAGRPTRRRRSPPPARPARRRAPASVAGSSSSRSVSTGPPRPRSTSRTARPACAPRHHRTDRPRDRRPAVGAGRSHSAALRTCKDFPRTIVNRGSRGSSHHSIRTGVRVKREIGATEK